ncbi:MAG: hypothetical protein ABW173_05845, partial [Sphingomonas sp.]
PPAPAPTPTFTYVDFDLSQDRVFAGQVASASTTERYTSDVAPFYTIESQDASLERNRGALELAYAASRSLVIRFAGETVTFAPADVQSSSGEGIVWRRARDTSRRGDAATFGRLQNHRYVYVAVQDIDEDVRQPNTAAAFRTTTRYLLIGERTRDGDVPTSGMSSYEAFLGTTTVGRNRGGGLTLSGGGTLSVDHATGTFNARLNVVQGSIPTGTEPERATLVLEGTVTTSGVTGTITSPDSGYTGQFTGDLFGPRAIETGMVLTLSRPDGTRAAGRLFGRRR